MSNIDNQDTIQIKDLISKILGGWYWFVLCGIIIMPAAYISVRMQQDVFAVSASILLSEKGRDSYTSDKFMKEIGLFINQNEVDDEIGILSSYQLIRKTLDRLDFQISYFYTHNLKTTQTYHYSPFYVELDTSHVQVLGAKFFIEILDDESFEIQAEEEEAYLTEMKSGDMVYKLKPYVFSTVGRFGKPYVDQNLSLTIHRDSTFQKLEPGKYYFQINSLDQIATAQQGALKIETAGKDSRLLTVSSEGTVVAMQNIFLNTLLDVYIEEDLKKQTDIGQKTLDLIDQQLLEITDSLREAEYSLKAFRANSNIVDINLTADDLNRQLTQLETEKAQLSVKNQYYTYVKDHIEKENSLSAIVAPATMGVSDPLLSDQLIRLAELKQFRAAKRASVKEGNPQLKSMDRKIDDAYSTILESINNSLSANAFATGDLQNRIDKVEGRIAGLPESERKLTNIERQFGQSEGIYKYLLQKRAEAAIALSTNTVNKYVVDKAKQLGNAPIAPNKTLAYLIGFILSIGIPIVFMVVVDFFNDKISGDQDIEANTKIPILGYVAKYEKNNPYVIEKDSKTSFAESFRSLRIKMLYMIEGGEKKILGITSSSAGEGKTFCATNLAVTLAHAGKKTLLIDTDLRRPKVHTYFQSQHNRGLADYLGSEAEYVNEIIHSTHIENLHIIPAGTALNNPTDLISNSRMKELMEVCRDEYDHIVFDTPPIGLVSDYLILMHFTEYNIYVVRHGITEVEDLKLINELYNNNKIKEIGLLVNGVESMSSYGYLDTDYGLNGYGKKNGWGKLKKYLVKKV